MSAGEVVEAFLERQRAMYAGGDAAPVADLLADDVVWHVPGASPIAGDYRGRGAVMGYFARRRSLANGGIAITKVAATQHDEALVQLADGKARLGDSEVVWRTAGVYRVKDGRIAEAWLVPLDQRQFEQAWAATRPAPYWYVQRVRPQDCASSKMLGHPRILEFFEAGFIECWRSRWGSVDETLGPMRRLTVATVDIDFTGPVRSDDDLRIAVFVDRITERSIQMHYDAYVEQMPVAAATVRYVCVDTDTGRPAALPALG